MIDDPSVFNTRNGNEDILVRFLDYVAMVWGLVLYTCNYHVLLWGRQLLKDNHIHVSGMEGVMLGQSSQKHG